MTIRQGDIFWADFPPPFGSEPGRRRPVLIIQNDTFNESPIATTIVCVVTSAARRAGAPGNVQLARGEANLENPSVVNVSQVYTLDRGRLGTWVGHISPGRLRQVLDGLKLVIEPREVG